MESPEPVEIGHKSELQVGTTALVCHVHPGRETCLECEPGVVQGCDSDFEHSFMSSCSVLMDAIKKCSEILRDFLKPMTPFNK